MKEIEKITGCAIRYYDTKDTEHKNPKVFPEDLTDRYFSHTACLDAMSFMGIHFDYWSKEHLFITSKGRLLDRTIAMACARANNQLDGEHSCRELQSDMIDWSK